MMVVVVVAKRKQVYARREVSNKRSNNLFRMTDDGCGSSLRKRASLDERATLL